MNEQQVTLSASTECAEIASEATSQRTIEWMISAPATARRDRAPLNLALILDRSGSMRGDKLRYVQQAATHVLDLLDDRDRVAVVAYDDQITIVASSRRVTADARRELRNAIDGLRSGGMTNLSDGWLTGCREIGADEMVGSVNRALLLTDGLANRGITDEEELARHARELRLRGIATSTFGVGLDFNEHLLDALATDGGGHFRYIERPQHIPEMFRSELGELLTVVAREAVLTIEQPRGVRVELLGDVPHERRDREVRVFVGDLAAGEQRPIYARVLTPPDQPGATIAIRAELAYADLDGTLRRTHADLTWSYARERDVLRLALDEALLRRASSVDLATTTARALRLERGGQRDAAKALLRQGVAAAAPYLAAADLAQASELEAQMDRGLSEQTRKQTHYVAYRVRNNRNDTM
jgi:Ca-activated chloride channel homolog